MSLSTFVKISSVSNLSDARYCAGMGVDQLGFCFDLTKKEAISSEAFLEIKNWLAGVQFVGEFGHLPADQIAIVQQQLPLDFIEISDIDQVEPVGLFGKPIIFSTELITDEDVKKLENTLSYLDELVEFVVLLSKNPDLFDSINKSVGFYHGRLKLIKGFDLSPSTVTSINGFAGIQLEGTNEEQPGLKNYDEMMDMLELLEDE